MIYIYLRNKIHCYQSKLVKIIFSHNFQLKPHLHIQISNNLQVKRVWRLTFSKSLNLIFQFIELLFHFCDTKVKQTWYLTQPKIDMLYIFVSFTIPMGLKHLLTLLRFKVISVKRSFSQNFQLIVFPSYYTIFYPSCVLFPQ